ncbi:hypothetical protein [Amycolatopsis sp.]|uniref:hypothetical protein n=1 Tax=Amycolatopsis sp. TaxID=37632 RepID=UPI002D7FAEE3|nr:hypothetical protein [Amycolatopsis sp.]HET6707351.1 hypothetical protein [Amycolatopsis sp.]
MRGGVLGVATAAIGVSAHVAGGGAVRGTGLTVGVAALGHQHPPTGSGLPAGHTAAVLLVGLLLA